MEDFIYENSQKTFGAKSGEQDTCYISVIHFWTRNCFKTVLLLSREHLVSWSIVVVENPNVGRKLRPFSEHIFT
jgi:hypothetical protein